MDPHMVKGLTYRLWCSCKRRWILMIFIIGIPILFACLFVYILSQNLFIKASRMEGPVIPDPSSKSQLLSHCINMEPIVVNPDNQDTRKLMEAAAKMFPPSVTFGPVIYKPTALKVEEFLANVTGRLDDKCSFGINFDRLSNKELAYTIRSTKSEMWQTTNAFPSIMTPGPMDSGEKYINQGFLALQIVINEAFSSTMHNTTIPEWEMQAFPYPEYKRQDNLSLMYTFMGSMNCYGLTILLCRFAVMMIQEKSSGVKELLKINGVDTWMIYASWFTMFGLLAAIVSLAVTLIWKFPYSFGVTLAHTDGFIFFIFLLAYSLSGLSSVGLLASFISNQKYGMLFTFFYWCGSASAFSQILPSFNRSYSLLALMSLLPNGAVYIVYEAIAEFETAGSGATFSNLFTSPSNGKIILPVGVTLLIMLLSTVICVLLMAYVDAIKPGPFGRAKPWHFIFCFKSCSRVHAQSSTLLKDEDVNSRNLVEEVGDAEEVGIRTSKLTKVFGTLRAVDDLNLSVYKNQITALLGHNGAGKSTLFAMISGMFSPTSGSVYAGSYDIFEDIRMFRKELGFCPQHDLLIDDLSVEQHIIFFCMIKGLSYREAKLQSDHWTQKFKIYESRHKRVLELSGGMKRKLCLSLALVGNPQYLLLDEPSSGLDPESRRDIWDVLLTMRGNRTIIISTHFMEEADALGDRIAIVAHGKLKCYGTKMFLKRHFGSGYQLNITMKKPVPNLASEIESLVPSATITNKTETSLTIGLPVAEVKKFPILFRSLGANYDKDIDYSLSCTTMDDVFLKVQEEEGVNMSIDDVDMPTMMKQTHEQRARQSAVSRIWQQSEALLVKRFQYGRANWMSFLFYIIIVPLIAMYLMMSGINNSKIADTEANVTLSMNIYGADTVSLVVKKVANDSLASSIESYLTKVDSHVSQVVNSESVTTALLNKANEDLLEYRTNMIVAFDTRKTPKALFSTLAYHSAPIAYGILSGTFLNQTKNTVSIRTNNYPYSFGKSSCSQASFATVQIVMMSIIYVATMLVTASYFLILPHAERITSVKHLQMMTGVQPILYWLINFIADITLFMVPIILSLGLLVILDTHKIFSYCVVLSGMALVLLLFGMSCIFFVYVFSQFFKSYTTSMEVLVFVSYVAAVVSWVGSLIATTEWFPYVFNLIPWVPALKALIKIAIWASNVSECSTCNVGVMAELCKKARDEATLRSFDINLELIYLAVDALLYLACLLAIDHGVFRMLHSRIQKFNYGTIEEGSGHRDYSDVTDERDVVTHSKVSSQESAAPPIFVCDGFGKKYSRNVTAVYDVTFAIEGGECFGLLGVNGAGKSTTFGMLTGSVIPTKGDSRIMTYSLSQHRTKYLKRLGYCPQMDGLLTELSARAMLKLFGRLRGIPPSELKSITQRWIDALDMTDICDRPCKSYSGGNKRKLSTAIALIADPPVSLLDEPTTGVDPVIRRKIWAILKYCRQANGQTIIITSHSMDECEAVCGRLTVMVKGSMKCIGTIPRLKNLYGQGYILLVKLLFTCKEPDALLVKTKIEQKFAPNIQLKDQQHGLYSFHITSKSVPLYTIFEAMIAFKSTYPCIEDFSVSDISLEQVFLSLAKA